MKGFRKIIWVMASLLALILLSFSFRTDELSTRRMEATIRFLADDLLEGRGAPSRGADIASLYLASELKAAGLKPANEGSYFQTFTVGKFEREKSEYEISLNGVPLGSEDFIFLPFGMDPGKTPMKFNLVFSGYGIFAPEEGIDDFKDIDIRGKAVVALSGAPWELDPYSLFGYDHAIGKSLHVAVRKGALLVYVSEEIESEEAKSKSLEIQFAEAMSRVPFVFIPEFKGKPTSGIGAMLIVKPSVFNKALAGACGGTFEELKTRLAQGENLSFELDVSLKVHIKTEPEFALTRNVVAFLEGNDPKLKDEWIILTAHYDHLGFYAAREGEDGIYNGADDNASGTAAILEVATRLASEEQLRRSLLIAFVTGEERGLLGSAYYSAHPLVPYEKVIVNINADMVGRSQGSLQALATGCDAIYSKSEEFAQAAGIKVIPDQHPSWRLVYFTDVYHFARFNVPFVQFFTDLHNDYHQPSDEIELIRFEELGRIFKVIYELTKFYAQGGEKPEFKRPIWFITPD